MCPGNRSLATTPRHDFRLIHGNTQVPFGWEEIVDRCHIRLENLFDLLSAPWASDFWMGDPCILVNFTEQGLAIDQLKRSPEKALKIKATTRELLRLAPSHTLDEFNFIQPSEVCETFANPVACARPRHDEFHLRELSDFTVVDISDQLIGQEIAYCGVFSECLEGILHGGSFCHS